MILADTSIWIDHFRSSDASLSKLLNAGRILIHPFVIGELALGSFKQRDVILASLDDLPAVQTATDQEVMHFIEQANLAGLGIGYVDAHLLASVRLTPDCALWTRDKRLKVVAQRMELSEPEL